MIHLQKQNSAENVRSVAAENLLAVTKIEEGKVNLNSSVEVMDEVITEALRHVNHRSREHTIRVTSAQELILAKIDARLIVQVIVNLVETPSSIRLSAP